MTNELIVLIVDDEPKVGELLKSIIEKKVKFDDKIVAHTVSSVQEAVKFVNAYHPDLVFLDIQMPEENGFELLKQVDVKCFEVVFTTAHEQYAIEAINNFNCLKYLLKPMAISDVQSVFDKYSERAGYQYYYKIVKNNSKRHLINVSDIVLCKAADNYCEVFLEDAKFLISKTLRAVEGKIQHSNFYRVNRSFLVNMDYVSHIDRTSNKVFFKNPLSINGAEEEFDIVISATVIKELGKWNL